MSKPIKPKTDAQTALIEAGLRAREMRKQLAVTWLASQEIIDAMRALRAGIKIPNKASVEVLENSAEPRKLEQKTSNDSDADTAKPSQN